MRFELQYLKTNRAHHRSANYLDALGWIVLILAAGFLAGAVASLESKIPAVLIIALMLGVALFLMNSGTVLTIVLSIAMVVAGSVQYFGRINQIQWLPSVLAAMMFLRAALELIHIEPGEWNLSGRVRRPLPYAIWLFSAFCLVAIGASIAGEIPMLQFIAGAKNYLAAWGVMILLVAARLRPEQLKRIWIGILAVAFIQLPIVLYQHFVVAARRAIVSAGYHRPAWDSVVGTFGGDPEGGGASGALAVVMIIALTILLSLWKRSVVKLWIVICGAFIVFITIALAEVKVVMVLIPLAVLGVFWKTFATRPGLAVFGGCLLVAILIGTASLYQMMYWGKADSRSKSAMENVERAFTNALDPDYLDPISGEVGRVAGLTLWMKDSQSTLSEKLLGHGLGASRVSPAGIGQVAKRYFPYRIGATTVTSMLWDVGLLGASIFTGLVLGAAVTATRLSRRKTIPTFHVAVLEAVGVSLGLLFVTTFYNSDVLYLPAVGILLMLMIGQVMYWQARISSDTKFYRSGYAGRTAITDLR